MKLKLCLINMDVSSWNTCNYALKIVDSKIRLNNTIKLGVLKIEEKWFCV